MVDQSQNGSPIDVFLDVATDLGPRTSAVIVSSLLVLGAYALGIEAMTLDVLGFPLGMWIILGGWLATSAACAEETRDIAGTVSTRLTHRARSTRTAPSTPPVRRRHKRPELRIAVNLDGDESAAITPDPDRVFGRVPAVHWGSLEHIEAAKADVIVRRDGNGTPVIEIARTQAEPAWMDWSRPLPLSYAGVFPARIDTRRITLDGADLSDPAEAALVGRLAEVAARASYLAAAESNGDRFCSAALESMDMAMRCIVDQLLQRHEIDELTETTVTRAAARVVSAWLSMREGVLPEELMRETLKRCAELLPDEPAAQLRLAAVHFATYADDLGLEALIRAHGMLSAREDTRAVDPLDFVFSEIQLGEESPLTLGRVAAGLCLVWASADEERLPHLKDDLLDDLRYAGWLIGRDPDHCLLKVILRELDHRLATRNTLWEPSEPWPALFARERAA